MLIAKNAKKVRELKNILQKAGFVLLPKRGKGSHSYWLYPLLTTPVILSGKDGSDAKGVIAALKELAPLDEEMNNEI